MNIYEVLGGLVCPIIVLVSLVLIGIFERYPIPNTICSLVLWFATFYCIWYNTNVRLNLFLAFVYGSILIFQLIGAARFSIIKHLEEATENIKNEVRYRGKRSKNDYAFREYKNAR